MTVAARPLPEIAWLRLFTSPAGYHSVAFRPTEADIPTCPAGTDPTIVKYLYPAGYRGR